MQGEELTYLSISKNCRPTDPQARIRAYRAALLKYMPVGFGNPLFSFRPPFEDMLAEVCDEPHIPHDYASLSDGF